MSPSKYDQWKLASPPDYSWAFEQAAEEFEKGYLDGEFDEALTDEDLIEELHDRMYVGGDKGYDWQGLIDFLETHFPRSFERAMERVVEERGNQIIEEAAHDDT